MINKEEITKKIISKGYFAKQIPSEFKSTSLSEHIEKLNLTKSKLSKVGLNRWCKLIDFSIPKNENFRRIISVPHPLHYILLAQLLEKKWLDLEQHFQKSEFSLTIPKIFEDRIDTEFKMSEKIDRRVHNLIFNKYILQADITRYYPSIYTHSIPWALHTKEVAKANPREESYFGNEIDRLVRNLQDGQTIGIPIGPVTSLIIQEIIGSAIDNDFKKEYRDNLQGYRYTDDMEYYFSSLEEAERALNILTKILKKYGLDINNSKTKIIKIPQVLEPEWVYYFKKYKFRENKNSRSKSNYLQNTDIKEFFSAAFKYKNQTEEKGILNYAIKVLRNIVINKDNWDIFESLLLQSIFVDSSIIPTVFETIESYKYRNYPLNDKRIAEFVNILIKDNIELRNDFEVSWALSFAIKLNIPIEENVGKQLLESENSIVNILVLILNSKDLIKGDLDFSHYKSLLTEESLYDENWLFYYECCINEWLGMDKSNKDLKTDKFFSQLLDLNISFVDPSFSPILETVKKSIISLSIKHYKTDMKDKTSKEIISNIVKIYSFSINHTMEKELNSTLSVEMKKLSTIELVGVENTKANVKKGVQEKEEDEVNLDTKIEVKDELTKGTKIKKKNKNNDWVSNFLTTDVNKSFSIRNSGVNYEY